MEKQIITFSANEQRLIKTGGIECYASNIVSYIEAHFDLGANWSGYDSVRAVWSNDNNMSVISTVLDADGICVVPFEVLKTKGVVKVNLVGSISVSDVLTDRLTTFPCEAVKVTAKAKIEGSETQPITPSQFEQFVAAVISEVEKVTGMTAQAETLPAGSQATARYENGILYLGIPQGIQGERGETGADGNGIASVLYNADYSLTLVFDNGERFTTPPIRGERGPAGADGRDGADGVTPNLSVGTVETLEPTQDAYVTRRGTDDNPIFDFGIPKGDKGDTGEVSQAEFDEAVSDLKNDFGEITGNAPISFKKGKGINTSGTVDVTSFVDSDLLDCAVTECSEGDVFVLAGKGGGTAYLLYAFVDSSGTKLQTAIASETTTKKVLTAPANTTHLVVNAYSNTPHYLIANGLIVDEVEHNSEVLGQITQKTILHQVNGVYPNALNTGLVWILDSPIPAKAKASLTLVGAQGATGATTVYYLRKNSNGTFTVLNSVALNSLALGDNAVETPANVANVEYYIGLYSQSNGIMFGGDGETNTYTRVSYSDIGQSEIPVSGSSVNLNFAIDLSYEQLSVSVTNNAFVTVSASGDGDYTSVLDAMNAEPENTVIFIRAGVYEQDMTACLQKRVILIGADRNQCIIRDTDGRYGHHALYVSCGYFENLTIEEPYASGTSQEIGMGLGAYAVHIDTDNDYAIGKQAEFYHCNIRSDFFPAMGVGLRKDMTLILDDCILENNQIANRGDYSDEGTLGALYFHDSNGEQGNQYVVLKNNVFKSKLQYAMCPYQVDRTPQNNRVYCDFINNVLYSDVGKYTDTVWFRGDPFNPSTGIFSIDIGYGNSIASLNNN